MKRISLPNIKMFLLQDKDYQGTNYLDNCFGDLHRQFEKAYKQKGESKNCVNDLNEYANKFYKTFKQSSLYEFYLKTLISKVKEARKHTTLSLVKNDSVKVTLHMMPKGFEIPTHAHPNQFSLIIVESGVLEVEQYSWGKSLSHSSSKRIIKQDESCIGLPIKDNLHYLKAGSSGVIFISIRMNSVGEQKQNCSTLLSILTKKMMPSALCFFLPIMSSMTTRACEPDELYNDEVSNTGYTDSKYHNRAVPNTVFSKPMSRNQARQSRQSSDYDSQVEAADWYLKSARRGSAESQYWLGVMHLDGSGTTEDDEEAFKWISLASDQNFKPAVKLLNHLITSDFDLEC